MESDLSLEFLRVVEQAAIACAHTMGLGDGKRSDHAAVEAMRRELDRVPIDGCIVIGEGERDEAPMLYIGERVGLANVWRASGRAGLGPPQIDIAVDPLEGTNLCATGAPGAIAVLAASERGGLLHAPDLYMEKLVVPSPAKNAVDIDAPVADNLQAIARALERRGGRSRHRGARPAPTREADRRHPGRRRQDSADWRRRPFRRDSRGRRRHRRARGHGHRWCARGRAHRGGDAVPERRDLRAAGRANRGGGGALPGHGDRRHETRVPRRPTSPLDAP